MNCVVYSRVSTDEQAEKGRSIDDQVTICEKFAKENEYKTVGIYKDPGKSATNMKRPALQDLLIRCQEDKFIDAVLVQDTDRLARNPSDHLQIKALLKKSGVQVISTSQPMVTGDSPESQFIDLVIAGMNQFQSQITGRKTSKVMEQKVLEGDWPGQAPLGYKNENIEGKNIISIDQNTAPYIKKTFQMYSTGVISIDNILKELNSKGFRTRYGRQVAKSVLANILKNPFYTGVIFYKEKIYQGNHKPIISKEIFDNCQNIIARRNLFATRDRKHKYLLRGIVFCGKCGARVYAEKHIKSSGKVFDYYYCKQCKPYAETAKIEKEVEMAFKSLKLSATLIKKIVAKAKNILEQTHSGADTEKRLISSQKSKSEARREELEDKLLDGTVNRETYKRKHKQLDDEIEGFDQEISKLEKDRSGNVKVFEELLFIGKNIFESYQEADPELKRVYLSLFWERFELKDGRIEKAVPTKLFQALLNQKSMLPNSKVRIKLDWLPRLDSNQ